MIHVYYGDGKGKTTAAMGLALRMLAAGGRVVIVQYLKDGESGDLVVKLVNLLPVAVKTDVEIPSLAGHQAVGQKTVLSGRPSDTNAVPVESAMEIGEKFPYEMPAYSFTVIRIKRECK